jgi:hypothetical protein
VSVDWFAHRHGERLSPGALGVRISHAIGSGTPVGVMFHHSVMDGEEIRRAAELLSLLAGHERVRPALMMELVEGGSVRIRGEPRSFRPRRPPASASEASD